MSIIIIGRSLIEMKRLDEASHVWEKGLVIVKQASNVFVVNELLQARLEAMRGSCKDSIKSVKSGIRCYLAFATHVLKKEGNKLPPTVNDLLRFSASFRCS